MTPFDDRQLMRRALLLAGRGYGVVHPNPMVGCVIVNDGEIVGEGWHRAFGGPHAEVDALRRAGRSARGGSLYVNLEPCAHHGKTPPCTEAIIAAGVREVIVAVKDPHTLVAGKGLAALRGAGVIVRLGAGREEAELLNERFLLCHREGRPFVGLKWAQSIDGRAVDHQGRSQWITGSEARREVHRLRAGYDAVLVGADTILQDNPRLTVRDAPGRSPIRVVLDRRLRVQGTERIFDDSARTLVLTDRAHLARPKEVVRRLLRRGVEVLGLSGSETFRPVDIVTILGGEGITSIMIEGGPTTIAPFVQSALFDKMHIFSGPLVLGGGRSSIELKNPLKIGRPLRLKRITMRSFSDGSLIVEGYRSQ